MFDNIDESSSLMVIITYNTVAGVANVAEYMFLMMDMGIWAR